MCNAYNHPSWCTCGFGPGRPGGLGNSQAATSLFDYSKAQHWRKEDFCHKTKCPKCDKTVWFISYNGGSVWVDELGPPWPKHPCFVSPPEVEDPFQLLLFERPAEPPLLAIVVQPTWHPSRLQVHLEVKLDNGQIAFLECDVLRRSEDLAGSLIFIYPKSRQAYLTPLGLLHTSSLRLASDSASSASAPAPPIQPQSSAPVVEKQTCETEVAPEEEVPAGPNWTAEQVAAYAARIARSAKQATASIPNDAWANTQAQRLVLATMRNYHQKLKNLLLQHFEESEWREVLR